MNIEPMIEFITASTGEIKLKADGSVPATLNGDHWRHPKNVRGYLFQEFWMSNFQDVIKRRGYGNIYLVRPHAERIMHVRVFRTLDGFEISYLD